MTLNKDLRWLSSSSFSQTTHSATSMVSTFWSHKTHPDCSLLTALNMSFWDIIIWMWQFLWQPSTGVPRLSMCPSCHQPPNVDWSPKADHVPCMNVFYFYFPCNEIHSSSNDLQLFTVSCSGLAFFLPSSTLVQCFPQSSETPNSSMLIWIWIH